MDCRQFREHWEPGAAVAESARLGRHLARCAACREWQAEQVATDRWLRASLRAVVEAPTAPGWQTSRQAEPPQPVLPRPWAGQVLAGRIGYAAAAALTAAAMLAAGRRPARG
jgi:predicted anti-sigma-YlaC factor YlaD